MHKRVIELYKQAAEFAYKTAGADAGKGTIIESLTAGKFAELIVAECAQVCLAQRDPANLNYKPSVKFAEAINQHFGVEQ